MYNYIFRVLNENLEINVYSVMLSPHKTYVKVDKVLPMVDSLWQKNIVAKIIGNITYNKNTLNDYINATNINITVNGKYF